MAVDEAILVLVQELGDELVDLGRALDDVQFIVADLETSFAYVWGAARACRELVEGDSHFGARALRVVAVEVHHPVRGVFVHDDEIPIRGKESVVGDHRSRVGLREGASRHRLAVSLCRAALRTALQVMKLFGEGCLQPEVLEEEAGAVVIVGRTLAGLERARDGHRLADDVHVDAGVTLRLG